MPQIMAEAFARGLLDKIMIEVLDIVDRNTQDGKSWEHVDKEMDDTQSTKFVLERSQAHEHTRINYSKAEEMELIAKIVHDLHNIQIGDSRYVLPSTLEKEQAKCTVYDDSASPVSSTDITETHTTQGQGDTHQIIHTATLESPTEPTEPAENEKESEIIHEATSVSVGLLDQLIEKLENKTVSICSEDNSSLYSTSKECIGNWEEKEEELIRTIESANNILEATAKSPRGNETADDFRNVGSMRIELKSRSSHHVASTSREARFEEIQVERHDIETRKAAGEATAKKKKKGGFGSSFKKFLRTVFGRWKN